MNDGFRDNAVDAVNANDPNYGFIGITEDIASSNHVFQRIS